MFANRHVPTGLAAVTLLVAALAAGCGGGSSTQAKPLGADGGSSTIATAAPVTAPAQHATSTSQPTSKPTSKPAAASGPTAAQITAAQNDLDAAGSSLAASDSAIGDSDVNRAKAQEGSAP